MTPIAKPRHIPAWRSLLFVPANVQRFVRKACGLAVDVVVLDLEDSIALDSKAPAREAAVEAAAELEAAGRTVFVRINQRLDLAVRDIETALTRSVAGLMLPKVRRPLIMFSCCRNLSPGVSGKQEWGRARRASSSSSRAVAASPKCARSPRPIRASSR